MTIKIIEDSQIKINEGLRKLKEISFEKRTGEIAKEMDLHMRR